MEHRLPPLIIISGSIGSGKGTVIHALVLELNLKWIPTHTTRPVRRDDATLSKRVFDTEENFLRYRSRGEFIESMESANGYYYGLLRSDLEKELKAGHPSIVELTVGGGVEVSHRYHNSLLIFLQANEKSRRERVLHRSSGHETEARMKEAAKEEQLAKREYDYLIDNIDHHPEEAIEAVKKLILEKFPHEVREGVRSTD